jgi:hypothetical protein
MEGFSPETVIYEHLKGFDQLFDTVGAGVNKGLIPAIPCIASQETRS